MPAFRTRDEGYHDAPLPHKRDLLSMAATGNLHHVKRILDQNSQGGVNERDCHDRTPLHYASKEGHLDVVSTLLEYGADVDARDAKEWTPLNMATSEEHSPVVEMLIEHGAQVRARYNFDCDTMLHFACAERQLHVVQKLLLSGNMDVNATSSSSQTPLMLACINSDENIVELLVQHGADVNLGCKSRYTALHYASQRNTPMIAAILIANGADVNAPSICGRSPLHFASSWGFPDTVQLLLDHDADIDMLQDGVRQLSALHFASEYGRLEVVQVLLRGGSNVHVGYDTMCTPLSIADNSDIDEAIIRHITSHRHITMQDQGQN